MATWTGAWSRPPASRRRPMLMVTGMVAARVPPDCCAAGLGVIATRPTDTTVPGTVVVPLGMVTMTASPGRTAGPPGVRDTETDGMSEVPVSTVVPVPAGAPSGVAAVVIRSGPGRNAT